MPTCVQTSRHGLAWPKKSSLPGVHSDFSPLPRMSPLPLKSPHAIPLQCTAMLAVKCTLVFVVKSLVSISLFVLLGGRNGNFMHPRYSTFLFHWKTFADVVPFPKKGPDVFRRAGLFCLIFSLKIFSSLAFLSKSLTVSVLWVLAAVCNLLVQQPNVSVFQPF